MVKHLTLFGMSNTKVPKKYKKIIKEYVLVEVPKIFPEDVINIPEWYLTDAVIELIYRQWEEQCLIKDQRSDFLEKLYQRSRGKYEYKKYDIDANLEFDEHVFESYHKTYQDKSRYSHLFRPSPVRKMY